MRISLAVPSLNHGQFLRQCLTSIREQSHDDVEVLIADAGSQDNSLAIIEEFAARDARFQLFSRADRGQADAVQRAFEASTGDIFGFLNADDCFVTPCALALVARAFDEHPNAGVVSFGGYYLGADGNRIKAVRLRYHPLDGTHLMRYRTAVLQPATFWRREVQKQFPLQTDLHYAFDAWFFADAHGAFEWVEVAEPIVGYRLHGANKSLGVRADRIRELARLEAHKFGPDSLRAKYLNGIAALVHSAAGLPVVGNALQRALYLGVNSLSFATVYRLPSI